MGIGGGGVATEDPRPSGRGIRGRVNVVFASLEVDERLVDSDAGGGIVFEGVSFGVPGDAEIPPIGVVGGNRGVLEKEV